MKCIVCGNEGERPRSKFCCSKCEQKYYYQTRKESRTEYKKEYYEQHKDECLQRNKEWVEENRDKWNEYQRKRRKEMKEK